MFRSLQLLLFGFGPPWREADQRSLKVGKAIKWQALFLVSFLYLGCNSTAPAPTNDWCDSFLLATGANFDQNAKNLRHENAKLRTLARDDMLRAVNAVEISLAIRVCAHSKSLKKSARRQREDQALRSGHQITTFFIMKSDIVKGPLSVARMKEFRGHLDALLKAYSGK